MAQARSSNRWLVLALAVTMQAVTIGIASYSFAFFVVPWMDEFGALRGTLMIAATGSAIGSSVLSPMCGYLLDRFSSRSLVLAGAAIFGAGLVGIAAAPSSVWVISIFVLVLPFGMVLAGTLMAATLVARSFVQRRGMALGISALGTSLGGLVMPIVITQVLAVHDWRTLFVILAGLVFVLVIAPATFILRHDGVDSSGATPAHKGFDIDLMRSPAVLKLGVAFLIPSLIFLAVMQNLGSLATDLTIHQQHAAWIVSTASAAMVAAKLLSGALSDRWDHRLLYGGILAIQAAGLLILSMASSFVSLLAAVILVCIGSGGNLPIITSFAAKTWGSARFGQMMGVVFAMAGLAGTGAMLAGIIRDASGSYAPAFAALILILLPAAWCFFSLSTNLPPRSQEVA